MAGSSPEVERTNKEKIFGNYLKVIPEKIYLNEIITTEIVSEEEVIYTITYKKEDGSLFDVGDTQNRTSEFQYRLKKINGQYKVIDFPPYQA